MTAQDTVPTVNRPEDSSVSANGTVTKLHFQVLDLLHPGTQLFFNAVPDLPKVFESLSQRCKDRLYSHIPSQPPAGSSSSSSSSSDSSSPSSFTNECRRTAPSIRSVTLFLRAFPGVAYTKSSDLDPEHKELHLSTSYLVDVARRLQYDTANSNDADGDDNQVHDGVRHEIEGVLQHELVHVWQRDGNGQVPGWWIEGCADYVRLKEGLGARHWREAPSGRSYRDSYETTAFFLDWLERNVEGYSVALQNYLFNDKAQNEEEVGWILDLHEMDRYWEAYVKAHSDSPESGQDTPPAPIPTHR